MVHAVVESLPRLTASDVSERTEWLTREMFRAFTAHQAEISVLFSGSRQGLFINRVEQAMCQCIAQTDPTFEADVVPPDGRKAPCDPACLHRPRRAADTHVTRDDQKWPPLVLWPSLEE